MKTNILNIIGFTLLSTVVFSQNRESNSVGINVEEPQATLDVKGNVKVKTLEPYKTSNVDLVRDNNSKRILGFNGTRPFNSLRIKLKMAKANDDWVSDFDTKIPIDDFTIFVTNANFLSEAYEAQKGNNTYKGSHSDSDSHPFRYGTGDVENDSKKNPNRKSRKLTTHKHIQVVKDEGTKTWHIKADYDAANPVGFNNGAEDSSIKFIWDIYLMAIHNSLVYDYTSADNIISPFGGATADASNNYTVKIPESNPTLQKILNSEEP